MQVGCAGGWQRWMAEAGPPTENETQQRRAFDRSLPGALPCTNLRLLAGCAGDEIEQLWHEYEDASSPEANLVKDFDKVGAPPALWAYQAAARHSSQRLQFNFCPTRRRCMCRWR